MSQERSTAASSGYTNAAFDGTDEKSFNNLPPRYSSATNALNQNDSTEPQQRENWNSPVEFLLSCISMSVGLGNIWRFPFVAFENGGGAFLIPYLIVLTFIGRPLYFLEMILGQFSSSGSVKLWDVVPAAKGIGYGQAIATWSVVTYYSVLMALAFFYLFSSFQAVLPWTVCDPAWSSNETCYSSSANISGIDVGDRRSSAELFFYKEVLKKSENFNDGLGPPEWRLSLCLLLCWILIFLTLAKGVSSSGKVAYFTALFPYAVLITLLVRGVTLPGAGEGMLYFVTPDWDKIQSPEVWYAAVTQCFFSLSVGFGPISTFASYNPFRHPIYRDATIVSLADTGTSILAGVTIFSILGNSAHETGKEIPDVVQGGTGLAFISYPEAISKFDAVPQLFAVLFFLMLITLAIGSAAGLTGCVITIICDDFPKIPRWIITAIVSIVSFFVGLIYVTPSGQYILDLVDYFGGGFIIYIMVITQTLVLCWVYGLRRILVDVRFMLRMGLGIYWKFTWCLFIPLALLAIFIYAMVMYEPMKTDDGKTYPSGVTGAGWALAAVAIVQIPAWTTYTIYKQEVDPWLEVSFGKLRKLWNRIKKSFSPNDSWGPKDPKLKSAWLMVPIPPLTWRIILIKPKKWPTMFSRRSSVDDIPIDK